jgi:hypothetical protein
LQELCFPKLVRGTSSDRTQTNRSTPKALPAIERVTFFNESGFAVMKVKAKTIAVDYRGRVAAFSQSTEWLAAGGWVHDHQFSRQFKAEML